MYNVQPAYVRSDKNLLSSGVDLSCLQTHCELLVSLALQSSLHYVLATANRSIHQLREISPTRMQISYLWLGQDRRVAKSPSGQAVLSRGHHSGATV